MGGTCEGLAFLSLLRECADLNMALVLMRHYAGVVAVKGRGKGIRGGCKGGKRAIGETHQEEADQT